MLQLRPLLLFLLLALPAWADLKVGTLNCYFLFDPAHPEKTSLKDKGPTAAQYVQKVENLATLFQGLDLVGLQEIGGKNDVEALAKSGKGYRACFVQGKDTYTGQDVGALVKEREGLTVVSAERNRLLEGLSKHLVVTLTEGKTRYAVLVVHLIRPIGSAAEKQKKQLASISEWVGSIQKKNPNTVVVVVGDFNNPDKGLLNLNDAAELNDLAATHITGKTFDRIFTSGKLENVEIVRPPYGAKPNDLNKMLWTDHFILKGAIK